MLVGSENNMTLRSFEDDTNTSYLDETFSQTVGSSIVKQRKRRKNSGVITQPQTIVLFKPEGHFHQESQAYYHYHKILSDNQYTLG